MPPHSRILLRSFPSRCAQKGVLPPTKSCFAKVLSSLAEGGSGTLGKDGRCPFSHPIDREDGGLPEWRGEEGAGSVGLVMIRGMETSAGVDTEFRELRFDLQRDPEPVLHPAGNGGGEGVKTVRGDGEGGAQDTVELEKRLLVIDNGVEWAGGLRKAVADRLFRKGVVVFYAAEALLLYGRAATSVLEKGRRRVMVVGADAEDAHQNWRV